LFRGESRSLSIWTSDFLEPNPDIEFLSDGSMLLTVEHEGRLSLGGDDVGSSECGIGWISAAGEIQDASPNANGVILWLIPTDWDWEEHGRIAIAPSGEFLVVLNGITFASKRHAVGVQQFDADGNFVGDFFKPHTADQAPEFNHRFPDIATNGTLHAVVWQDGRQDANWDITMQFYTNNGPLGNNFNVNSGDQHGTINVWPSIAMNPAGASVVVWADTRDGTAGDTYGQRYNAAGQAIGDNFKISTSQGEIWDRPEVAMLDDGSFAVVWTDSASGESGIEAFRAKGRQFDANGDPLGDVFIVPDQDVASGLVNIASNGNVYYCSWLDDRQGSEHLNIYAKQLNHSATSVSAKSELMPEEIELLPAFPNPFNPSTSIRFNLADRSHVSLKVFNLLGHEVRTLANGQYEAGEYKVVFNADGLPSGVYVYRLATGGAVVATRKVLLLK
jgi:hypothetical protein